MLLFSLLSTNTVTNKILALYTKHINSLGHYHNRSFRSIGLKSFPYSIDSNNHLFLSSFFNLIFSETKSSLSILALNNFSELNISNLYTRFGSLSLSYQSNQANEITIDFSHSFNYSPKNIFLSCPEHITYYSFSGTKKSPVDIKSKRIKVPLNQSRVTLYSS